MPRGVPEDHSEFHDQINFPVPAFSFRDPERFPHTQSRLTGAPLSVLKRIDNVLLPVTVEEMHHISIDDWKLQILIELAMLWNHWTAQRKARWDRQRETPLRHFAGKAVPFVIIGWVKEDAAFTGSELLIWV
jgi:hypothetical protein